MGSNRPPCSIGRFSTTAFRRSDDSPLGGRARSKTGFQGKMKKQNVLLSRIVAVACAAGWTAPASGCGGGSGATPPADDVSSTGIGEDAGPIVVSTGDGGVTTDGSPSTGGNDAGSSSDAGKDSGTPPNPVPPICPLNL